MTKSQRRWQLRAGRGPDLSGKKDDCTVIGMAECQPFAIVA